MAIVLRDLLSRVALYRPDLNGQFGESQSLFAIYDAARRIARETHILKQEVAAFYLPANTHLIDFTAKVAAGTKLNRVWNIFYGRPPVATQTYLGTWNASTNTPTLTNSASLSSGSFYAVTSDGNTALGSETYWNVGDIIWWTGTTWKKQAKDTFYALQEANKPSKDTIYRCPQNNRTDPREYGQENGTVVLYPPPRGNGMMFAYLSVVPDGDVDDMAFPEEAEEVILQGAKAYLLELPGGAHNLGLAQEYKRDFKEGIARLKGVGIFGWGGMPEYLQGNFTGRLN